MRLTPPHTSVLAGLCLLAVSFGPAAAQGFGNPFAATPGAGLGPYGNGTGASVHLMQLGPLAKAGTAAIATRPTRVATEAREPPHRAELPEGSQILEAMFIGCSAGAFLGGYTAWSTVVPAVGAEVAVAGAPVAAAAAAGVLSASAIGCGLGAATGVVTLAAGTAWNWAFR